MTKPIFTVGNMVDVPEDAALSLHDHDNNLIFLGKMSYEPNIVAVSFFAHSVFPELKKQFHDLKFIIVGANPDERVLKLASFPGVEVTGFVDSIEPYFHKATIMIAPMLTGAGVQNKILQSMSYGCCVATTPIGAEGLTINNNEIAIFNDAEDWIKGISSLLMNREERLAMGRKANDYIKANLSREIIQKQFDMFIDYPYTKA